MIGLVPKQDRFPAKEGFSSIGARSFSDPELSIAQVRKLQVWKLKEPMKTPGRSFHRQAEADP
jgi:hypothetical protein